jgi:hypothetical protein
MAGDSADSVPHGLVLLERDHLLAVGTLLLDELVSSDDVKIISLISRKISTKS